MTRVEGEHAVHLTSTTALVITKYMERDMNREFLYVRSREERFVKGLYVVACEREREGKRYGKGEDGVYTH